MFTNSDYNTGPADAPTADTVTEIQVLVQSEVSKLTTHIASDIVDQATAGLTDRFALKTDVSSVTTTVNNQAGTITDLAATVNGYSTTITGLGTDVTGLSTTVNNQAATIAGFNGLRTDVTALTATVNGHSTTIAGLNSQYALKTEVTTLGATVNNQATTIAGLASTASQHTSALALLKGSGADARVVLGGAAGSTSNEVIVSNAAGTKLLRWPGSSARSAVQAIELDAAALSSLLELNTMMFTYTVNQQLKVSIRDQTGTILTMNLSDAAGFATSTRATSLETQLQQLKTQVDTLVVSGGGGASNDTVNALIASIAKLNGTNVPGNVTLGAYSPAANASNEIYVSDGTGVVHMSWTNENTNAIQTISGSARSRYSSGSQK